MSRSPLLALRTEMGEGVGAGHVARCLALAEAWVARGGSAIMAVPELHAPWDVRVATAGVTAVMPGDLPDSAEWCVADGYRLGWTHADLRARGRLLVIDDFGETAPAAADAVVDQNLGADAYRYPAPRVLLGPRYALMRRAVRDAVVPEPRPRVERVIVSLGGFPPPRVRTFADALIGTGVFDGAEVLVMDGSVDPAVVVPAADLAVSTAGSFLWELCRFGVPTVVVSTAPNQRQLAAAAAAAGVAVDAGPAGPARVDRARDLIAVLVTDGDARRTLGERARQTVDGWGADRVVTMLRGALLQLRPVSAEDAELLLHWANDPSTRQASFRRDVIAVDEHRAWLGRRLRSDAAAQFVGMMGSDEPVGFVRFDRVAVEREGWQAEIGVVVAPEHRGQGLAAALIDGGCRALATQWGPGTVRAYVRPENERSRAAFASADFDPVGGEPIPAPAGGGEAVRYARRCDGR